MIRLNPGSSGPRRRPGSNGSAVSRGSRTKASSARSKPKKAPQAGVDVALSSLVGGDDGRGDAGTKVTHDDMYDDDDGTKVKVTRLFEELLGDDASAIGSAAEGKEKRGGEEGAEAMSSVLGPLPASDRDGGERGKGNGEGGRVPSRANGPAPLLKSSPRPQNDEGSANDEDTYMTKPRMIAFDSNADDVSALFGGQGVESYLGTYARSRGRDRSSRPTEKSGGVMGMFGGFGGKGGGGRGGENGRKDDDANSILEEIGGNKSKKNLKGSFNSDDRSGGDKKGHRAGGRWNSTPKARPAPASGRTGRRRGAKGHRDAGSESLLDRVRRVKSKTWTILVVSATFVSIQFTSIKRYNRRTSDHLNWRFQNHRYATARDSAAYSSGLSPGIRDIAMDNVEDGGDGRRKGTYDANSLNGDRIGDVLRKSVPLVPERKLDAFATDDGISGLDGDPNYLRGGGQMRQNQWQQQQQQPQQQQQSQQWQQQQQQQPRAMQQPQQDPPRQQLQPPAQQPPMGKRMADVAAQPPSNDEAGDPPGRDPPPPAVLNHPLLAPKKGLSMADALDKLGGGGPRGASDRLSDLDPRPPRQSLTNDLVPDRFRVFADVKTPFVPGRDTPYFWHVPRSGGVVVKTMLSHCLGQTLAAEVGELEGHGNDSELKVITFSEHNYTNVNVATPEGIARALNLGLVPSHLSDTLVSAHVDLMPSLFNANDRARAFVLFRHPVDRAASMFYFLKGTGYPPLQNMTVDDYAKSELIENNWLVRILTESMTGPIDMDNLEIAKEVLRRKFIVGLLDNKRGSFARFDHYFKWKESMNYQKEFGCRKQLMDEKYKSKHPIRKDSETWKLLLEQNRFDVHLYDFAKELFSQQSYIFGL
ncbi:hypothetical protein ACHAWF_016421 [Thalassiosira exigua]